MRTATEDFLKSFYEIAGTTIGERRKNLFLLLNHTKRSNHDEIDFGSIEPTTILEESFKVQVLLYFNKMSELIGVLKSENPKLISKLMNKEFLENFLENVSDDHLVEEYFPWFSFNTKVKLINKLCLCIKDENRADALFAAIEKKYGFYLATKLLPCCSPSLILHCANTLRFELTSRQLLRILRKHPDLTEEMFKALSRYTETWAFSDKYKKVFIHLLKTDLQLFLKMEKLYGCNARVGWRSTQKIIFSDKNRVETEAGIFYKCLHEKQLTKSLAGDFFKFYANMLPASLSRFKDNVPYYIGLLKYLPGKTSQLNSLMEAFQSTYGCDLWTAECVHKDLLELMSVEDRDSWISSHSKPEDISEEAWICLMKIEKSIPELKKRISLVSDVRERSELVGCLVETCRINEDDAALLDVCKYMCVQHRKAHNSVLLSFLETLRNCYQFDKLSDGHWKCVTDLVENFAKEENSYHHNQFLLEYVNYLIWKGTLMKEEFVSLFKKINLRHGLSGYMKRPAEKKKFLLAYGDALPDISKSDDLKENSIQFLNDVLLWNRKYPHDKIALLSFKSAVEIYKKELKDFSRYQYLSVQIIVQLLRSDIDDQDKEECLEAMLNRENLYVDVDLFIWFVKQKPSIIDKFTDGISKILLNARQTGACVHMWRMCCNYAHLNIPQRFQHKCAELFQSEEGQADKKNVAIALSCLMPPKQYTELIESYYPTDLRMDVNSEDQDLYNLQQGITISLKNVTPSSIAFDSIRHFSQGDYMKFIQRTLHSVSHSASETNLIGFFSSFRDSPVSVRKHAIYQTFKVLDKAAIVAMLNHLEQNERNSSILKIIFKGTFNYFVKNPSEHSFGVVQKYLKSIDFSDEEAFETLLSLKKIPVMYLPEYLTYSYGIFEKLPETNAKAQEGKVQLLTALTPELLTKVPEEFSWRIVASLFKNVGSLERAIQTFVCRFLAYSVNDKVADVFNIVFSSWSNGSYVVKQQVAVFLHDLCMIFIADRAVPKERLQLFTSMWNGSLEPYQAFHEYLELYFATRLLDGEDLTKSIYDLCDRFKDCDPIVAFDIAQVLGHYLSEFLSGTEDILELNRLDFIRQLVNTERRVCVLIGLALLPESFPKISRITESYEDVLGTLRNCKDSAVSLYFSSYNHKLCLEKLNVEELEVGRVNYKSLWYFPSYTSKYRL